MTDQDLDGAISQALGQPDVQQAMAALAALRDQLAVERGPLDPALGRTWDALVRAAGRSSDDVAELMAYAEQRARWLAAARGPSHPDTIAAWIDLGETAALEYAWDVAVRAWEAVVNAPVGDAGTDSALRSAMSRALRGLGARRLAAQRLDDARALFERDLAVHERAPSNASQLAISLDSMALVLEQLGDRAGALALRTRQRAALGAASATEGQLATLDERIAKLSSA
jgi:hypothetical protein